MIEVYISLGTLISIISLIVVIYWRLSGIKSDTKSLPEIKDKIIEIGESAKLIPSLSDRISSLDGYIKAVEERKKWS